jgi:saccharopine dehydrogenase (NAD+, L-lysine-forming)
MKIGIIREGKVPADKRVALLPHQCQQAMELFPQISLFVQPSNVRCVADEAYQNAGIPVTEDLSHCDTLFGIKEVPVDQLIANKTYFFFSHTVKKQKYNRHLLQTILKKNITLVDYECLTGDEVNRQRIIAFGRYAGIVGAYNAFWTFGKKYGLFDIKRAHHCDNMAEMQKEYARIQLPPIKIALTGSGRVGKGVLEVLQQLQITEVSPQAFVSEKFNQPVYTVLQSKDYHQHKDGLAWDSQDFHKNPQNYTSSFYPFAQQADVLITSAFWHPKAPKLFSKEDMQRPDFRVRVIADISCDVDGSVPCTVKTTTIADPVFDYNITTGELQAPFSSHDHITVMAIDNLPCELPYDASAYFGEQLIHSVLPLLLQEDPNKVIERATITRNGKLTQYYQYLEDFVQQQSEETPIKDPHNIV